MEDRMINDFYIEGLALSVCAFEVQDIMLYIFKFSCLGTVILVIYSLQMKANEGLKSSTLIYCPSILDVTRLRYTNILWLSSSSYFNNKINSTTRCCTLLCFSKEVLKFQFKKTLNLIKFNKNHFKFKLMVKKVLYIMVVSSFIIS